MGAKKQQQQNLKSDSQHRRCLLTVEFLRSLLLLFHLAFFALPSLSTHPLYSLKFFLSLYGHKLPATTLDISSDSTLLISGSADKNIKVGWWGLGSAGSLSINVAVGFRQCWCPLIQHVASLSKTHVLTQLLACVFSSTGVGPRLW